MKKAFFVFSLLIFFAGSSFAGNVSHTINVPRPEIGQTDSGAKVTLDEALSTGQVGNPVLPVWGLNLLLPPGEEAVAVTIVAGEPVSLGLGYRIDPVQQQHPLSMKGPFQPDAPNPDVYESDSFFPAERVAMYHTDFYRGHGIAAIAVNPVDYNPVTGELRYYPNITVNVQTSGTGRSIQAYNTKLKNDPATRARLIDQVANKEYAGTYGQTHGLTDEPYFDILLITHETMVPLWSDYIDWKTKCGYYVAVETVQDIYASYQGVDNPDKIRNCIIHYYETFDLIYVFLAGDDEIIPHRGLYSSSGYVDNDIAGDCYFAGLDGNWNDDGDTHWGEPNEADLRAEVYVSRAAVDSETEINNFVNKQMMYMRQPVVDEVETALMVGEDLGWPIWAWEYKEEVRLGTSSWGFQTAPFPPNFETRTLYETPGNYWSGLGDLAPLMNQGPIYINHLGHADVDYMMQLNNSQVTVSNFTNNGIDHNFYLVYSQGCYCGSFDNRTTGGSYVSDCITETFSTMPTGAVAMITNSRYGWGHNTTTQGSSQYYDKQFFDAIWGENITIASEANTDSKTDCIPYIDYNQNRWCFYELNLFSEPTLDLWTAEPTILPVNYAGELFLGANSFQVEVPGVEGARVCLSKDGEIYAVGFTDASGQCTLIMEIPIQSVGEADLYVTAHDRIPHEGQVLVIPPTGPYVIYNAVTIDDQNGNNNGQWDYGETVSLDLTVENVGVENAVNVTANLSTEDPLVTITGANVNFGNIAQGNTGTVSDAFGVTVDGSVEDGNYVSFTLTATDGINEWISYFTLQNNAPDVVFDDLNIDDSIGGNGNGSLDPGETAVLNVTLCNEGGCYSTDLMANLSTLDPYITIVTSQFEYGEITSAGGTAEGSFEITVSNSCPQEHSVEFNINMTDAIGYTGETGFSSVVGDLLFAPVGPDNYGYSAYDPNDMPEFPVYEWIEICPDSGGSGISVPFINDDQVLHYALPFEFQYYGLTYDSLSIGSNGWIAMGFIPEEDYSNSGIPNSDGPAAMIASYWEDLSPQRTNTGGVWRYFDANQHIFIVEFNHIEQYAPTGNFETFQTILYDPAYYETSTGDGRIKVQYKNMSNAFQDEGTIGIESPDETDGLQFKFDEEYDVHATPIANETAILYSTATSAPSLAITLTPINPPIIIPANGGTFNYNVAIENTGASTANFDAWIVATLPGGSLYNVLTRPGLALAPGGTLLRQMTQNVPGAAPEGGYLYSLYGGNSVSGLVWAEDSFTFEKTGVDASGVFNNWGLTGWDDTQLAEAGVPSTYSLKQNYPNPFNPETTIEFELPETAKVSLAVYNTLGQQTALLIDGILTAGYKSVKIDASDWSSGIYFYRLQAGNYTSMKKMVLLK